MKFYYRWQTREVKNGLNRHRVVLLTGPRQCGKTTLAKEFISEDVGYVTLDDLVWYESAKLDPQSFVDQDKRTLIIDEVQRVPVLLIAIKKIVDENLKPGQFLITGSANIQEIPTVRESLAGRVTRVRLRTLSQGEILGAKPSFFEHAFIQNFKYSFEKQDKDKIISLASTGGFPEPLLLDDNNRRRWHLEYVRALLDRDLLEIANIYKHDSIRKLVEVLAAWSSKFMDKESICSVLSIRRETLDSYVNALESLYLVEQVPAWYKTDFDRVGKRAKIFMTDSGLMSSILAWNPDQIKFQPDALGKLLETFAMNELAVQVDVHEGHYELFHYRDRDKREIDFLIERTDGALLGIEVKASSTVTGDDFKHLKWFQEHLTKDRPFIGIVLYTGVAPIPFSRDLWAIPFSMLWPNES